MYRGGASGNGLFAISDSVPRSLCRSFQTKCSVHGYSEGDDIAANQICQSIRGWYGATNGGRRFGSPGLALNSYSFHFVSSVTAGSVVPSNTISIRSCPTDPKAP